MKIVQRPDGFVTAYFDHTCGHQVGMFYGGEEFAKLEQAQQESQKCISCRNSDHLASYPQQQQ